MQVSTASPPPCHNLPSRELMAAGPEARVNRGDPRCAVQGIRRNGSLSARARQGHLAMTKASSPSTGDGAASARCAKVE